MNVDFLLVSGCSFTDGGGLDSPTFMRQFGYNTNTNEEAEYDIRNSLRWSRLVSNYFNSVEKNISLAGNSNDNIRRSIVDYIDTNKEQLKSYKNKVCIVQSSFSHRVTHSFKLGNDGDEDTLVSFNPHEAPNFKNGDRLFEYYRTYLELIFDHDKWIKNHYYDLLTLLSYLKENEFTPYLIFFDNEYEPYSRKFKEAIWFDNKGFGSYVEANKERFCDVIDTSDSHFTPNGNKLIADVIINRIVND